MDPETENFKKLHDHLHRKFIALKLTIDEFENEIKESGFQFSNKKDGKHEASDIMFLVTRQTCKSLNRELLLKFDLFEKKLRLLDLFHDFDTDKNDALSKNEFLQAMTTMGFTQDETESMFSNFDTDNDDTISLSEFIQAFERFLIAQAEEDEQANETEIITADAPSVGGTNNKSVMSSSVPSTVRQTSQLLMQDVSFETNMEEISQFIKKVSNDSKIEDKYANEIITQLTSYISKLTNDCKKHEKLFSDLQNEYSEMETDYWEMKEKLVRLQSENEIRKSVHIETTEHLRQLTENGVLNDGVLKDRVGSISEDLKEDNNENDDDNGGNNNNNGDDTENVRKENATLANVLDSIGKYENQLESLEKEIEAKKEELKKMDNTLKSVEELERQNSALTSKLAECQETIKTNESLVKEQDSIIEGQNGFITQLTDQVQTLETDIVELKDAIAKEDSDLETLKQELAQKEQIVRSGQMERQQSAQNLLMRFQSFRGNDTNSGGLSSLAYVASYGSDDADGAWDRQASSRSIRSYTSDGAGGGNAIGSMSLPAKGKKPQWMKNLNNANLNVINDNNSTDEDQLKIQLLKLQDEIGRLKNEKVVTGQHLNEIEKEYKEEKIIRKKFEKEKIELENKIEELKNELENAYNNRGDNSNNNNQDNEEKVDEKEPLIANGKKRRSSKMEDLKKELTMGEYSCVVFGYPIW